MFYVTYWANEYQQRRTESAHKTLSDAKAFVEKYGEKFPSLQLQVGF